MTLEEAKAMLGDSLYRNAFGSHVPFPLRTPEEFQAYANRIEVVSSRAITFDNPTPPQWKHGAD